MRGLAVFSFSALLTSSAFASVLPNLYVCKGEGLTVVYSTSSIVGQKTMSVDDGSKSISARGDELQTVKTIFGDVVSVYAGAIPDYSTSYTSVVIPLVQLDPEATPMPFSTHVMKTLKATSFRGRDSLVGQLDVVEVIPVKCEASLVQF